MEEKDFQNNVEKILGEEEEEKEEQTIDDFDLRKNKVLRDLEEHIDFSRKGSLDVPLVPLIQKLNKHENYVTTSSCSGRIAVFYVGNDDAKKKSGGGGWLFVSHEHVTPSSLVSTILPYLTSKEEMITFRFEPMLLHVDCRELSHAQQLLQVAIGAGFRESGIVVGKRRAMVGIRTTSLRLEVPLSCNRIALVSETYLQFLVNLANEHMTTNLQKIETLLTRLNEQILDVPIQKKSTTETTCWNLLVPPNVCEQVRQLLLDNNLLDSSRRNSKLEKFISVPVISSAVSLHQSLSLPPSLQEIILTFNLEFQQGPTEVSSQTKNKKNTVKVLKK